MPNTAQLDLPYIQPSQAQKHVTHNEALRLLDVLVQLRVQDFDMITPPPTPVDGDAFALGGGPTGVWAGQDHMIAVWDGTAWGYVAPKEGWRGWGITPQEFRVWDGAAWVRVPGAQDNLDHLGINTTADAGNRLAVSSAATLFSHDGDGHHVKVNKNAAGDTAGFLLQTNFSGRAELGLVNDDDFHIKVSPDGQTWVESLVVNNATGLLTGAAVQNGVHDTNPGRLLTGPTFGWGQSGDQQSNVSLNAVTTSGVHQFAPTDPDRPVSTGGSVLVVRYSSNWVSQIGFGANDTAMWLRRSQDNGSTWTAWVQLYHQENILGPVSESLGAPTGAVIERNGNANGEYVRFADGTQICWKYESLSVNTTATGNIHNDLTVSAWTFPAAFSVNPVVSFSVQGAGAWGSIGGAVTTTNCPRQVLSAAAVSGNLNTYSYAVARWF